MSSEVKWDYSQAAEAMLTSAKDCGILPADLVSLDGKIPEDADAQYREAARIMIKTDYNESVPVEDNLWYLFGVSFSSALKRVLVENEGIAAPFDRDSGYFCCDEDQLPLPVRIIADSGKNFARYFTYDLDPDDRGSWQDEQFRAVFEKCLILSQEIGDFFGRELIKKKRKLGINLELLKTCSGDIVDYSKAEELLKQGAEPLGYIEECGYPNNLYDEIAHDITFRDDKNGDLFKITELFLQYGMDISKPAIPYDNDEILNPVSQFCGYMQGSMMETLRLLLDHGLTAEDAECGWGENLEYLLNVNDSLNDENVRGELPHYIHKLMLTASYPHVLNIAPNGTQMYMMITKIARPEHRIVRGMVTLLSVMSIRSLDAFPERVAVDFASR